MDGLAGNNPKAGIFVQGSGLEESTAALATCSGEPDAHSEYRTPCQIQKTKELHLPAKRSARLPGKSLRKRTGQAAAHPVHSYSCGKVKLVL